MPEFSSRSKLDAIAGNAAEHAAHAKLGQLELPDGDPQHFEPLFASVVLETIDSVFTTGSLLCGIAVYAVPIAVSDFLSEEQA